LLPTWLEYAGFKYQGTALELAEKLVIATVSYQGMTLVMP